MASRASFRKRLQPSAIQWIASELKFLATSHPKEEFRFANRPGGKKRKRKKRHHQVRKDFNKDCAENSWKWNRGLPGRILK